jgi:hypothetical protein
MEINYKEIDRLCSPMVRLFNKIGLPTQFSCQGHDDPQMNSFYVIFQPYVSDDDIKEFLSKVEKSGHTPLAGSFHKWMRSIDNEVVSNWMYIVNFRDFAENQQFAKYDCAAIAYKYKINYRSIWHRSSPELVNLHRTNRAISYEVAKHSI